jgi:nucleotide-binding universal stress UspA family protein
MTTRPILCGIDFSPGADRAIDHAVAFARSLDAPLVLAYVMDTAPDADPATPHEIAEAERVLRARVHDRVSEVRARLAERAASITGVPVETIVLDGRPGDALVTHAAKIDASYVVVGAHGKSGAHSMRDAALGWLLGSTAERVVRAAGRPVLVVPPT